MKALVFSHQAAVLEETSQREAYLSVLPELQALSSDQLRPVNIDVQIAIAKLLGALPRLRTQRDALMQLADFDLDRFDKLELYSRALGYAHRLYLIASQPVNDLQSIQEEAIQLREVLYRDASAVIARGLILADALDDLRGANGYKNTANDLQILVGALQENWEKVQGKCGTTEAELVYADKLVTHLLRVYGERQSSPGGITGAIELRLRAFTLFVDAYEDTRQAVAYVHRRTGDGKNLAPSLFAGRRPHKKAKAKDLVADAGKAALDEAGSAGTPSSPASAAQMSVAAAVSQQAANATPPLASSPFFF